MELIIFRAFFTNIILSYISKCDCSIGMSLFQISRILNCQGQKRAFFLITEINASNSVSALTLSVNSPRSYVAFLPLCIPRIIELSSEIPDLECGLSLVESVLKKNLFIINFFLEADLDSDSSEEIRVPMKLKLIIGLKLFKIEV